MAREHRNPLALVPAAELADREARRELLSELRANGVDLELRDGREYRVLRLPGGEPEVVAPAPRVEPRRARAARIA